MLTDVMVDVLREMQCPLWYVLQSSAPCHCFAFHNSFAAARSCTATRRPSPAATTPFAGCKIVSCSGIAGMQL